ncbi:hypothetical protein X925_08895 [Petrotoga sp. 9T1HF07.CasAA.8.2]|jgi:hypothetical protein|uniref:hypothetical protein n=1 Tax=Petrotoga sp. 9T1HF07.CasAA.8.2 TaxID=1434329 RepID=UPI000CB1652E|nr:hypothetical protein [Petrotoga sp. 9T1HF07.CasAA.8.2]PNR87542.1 hypothetical protein X925_08895 [Petrotoga sp. 9T1HF07.CasAA.8.2]
MTDNIKKILSSKIDPDLVEHLLEHYKKLKQKFFLSQYEPSQLNCAKFGEVVMRILEDITKGSYTSFDKTVSLNTLSKKLEQLPKGQFPDSIRIHIPRILRATYDIRSKRGVAHIGEITPNLMDATFVVSACDWIMAEFVRLYYSTDPTEAQKIISSIVERRVPIIEEFGGDIKVLSPNLTVPDKILVILYKKYPDYVSTSDLKKWIKTKSPSHITTVLSRLDNNANIHRKKKENIITRKGIDYVEKKLLRDL